MRFLCHRCVKIRDIYKLRIAMGKRKTNKQAPLTKEGTEKKEEKGIRLCVYVYMCECLCQCVRASVPLSDQYKYVNCANDIYICVRGVQIVCVCVCVCVCG